MARPPNTDAAVTRARILDSALELFADRGFFGTSMRQIGAAAGVTGSALYHHFENKEAILHAVVGEMSALAEAQLARLMENGDIMRTPGLQQVFKRACTQILGVFELPLHRKLFRVMMTDGVRLQQEGVLKVDELMQAQRARVGALVGAMMEAGLMRKMNLTNALMLLVGPLIVYRQLFMIWGSPVADRKQREAFIRDYSETMARAFAP